jgi:preprotein translocase subunit SecG
VENILIGIIVVGLVIMLVGFVMMKSKKGK